MSEKTRSVKTKDVTSEEAEAYLMEISALLNEIARLEEEKSEINKSFNKDIKREEEKLEKIRIILNDGIIITLHNFMDKDTHEIIWKDEDGNEIERTPFDERDWEIWEKQYGPRQKPLFNEDGGQSEGDPEEQRPALNEGDIIDAESEDIDSLSNEQSPFDEHGEEEVEAERDAL